MKAWEVKLVKPKTDVPDPLGYTKNLSDVSEGEARPAAVRDIMEKKVKSFAMSPAGQILMALLMLYLSGGGLNIFMIFFTFQVLVQPLKALVGINAAFKQFEGYKISLLPYKLMYAAIQSVILGIGGYRLYSMGLLPLTPADWIDLIPRRSSQITSFAIQN